MCMGCSETQGSDAMLVIRRSPVQILGLYSKPLTISHSRDCITLLSP